MRPVFIGQIVALFHCKRAGTITVDECPCSAARWSAAAPAPPLCRDNYRSRNLLTPSQAKGVTPLGGAALCPEH